MKLIIYPLNIKKILYFFFKYFKSVLIITSITTLIFYCGSYLIPKKKEVKFLLVKFQDYSVNLKIMPSNYWVSSSFLPLDSYSIYEKFNSKLENINNFSIFLDDLKIKNRKYNESDLNIKLHVRSVSQNKEFIFQSYNSMNFQEIIDLLTLYFRYQLEALESDLIESYEFNYSNSPYIFQLNNKKLLCDSFKFYERNNNLADCRFNEMLIDTYTKALDMLEIARKQESGLFNKELVFKNLIIEKRFIDNGKIFLTFIGFVLGLCLSILTLKKYGKKII